MLITRPLPAELPPERLRSRSRTGALTLTLDTRASPVLFLQPPPAATLRGACSFALSGGCAAPQSGESLRAICEESESDSDDPEMAANSMWALVLQPRPSTRGYRRLDCSAKNLVADSSPALHVGVARSPSWDPFYFVDHCHVSLLLCHLPMYLNNGAVPATVVLYFYSVRRTYESRARLSSRPCSAR